MLGGLQQQPLVPEPGVRDRGVDRALLPLKALGEPPAFSSLLQPPPAAAVAGHPGDFLSCRCAPSASAPPWLSALCVRPDFPPLTRTPVTGSEPP